MKLAYDEKSRGLFIILIDGDYAESREVAEGVVVDFDPAGRALRIELEDATAVVDVGSVLSMVKPRIRSGEDLRQLRESLGLSQKQLGDALEIPRNTIARWERGELQMEKTRLIELAISGLLSGGLLPMEEPVYRRIKQTAKGEAKAFRGTFKVAAKVGGRTAFPSALSGRSVGRSSSAGAAKLGRPSPKPASKKK